MTPNCAADIRASIVDIRSRLAEIEAQTWEYDETGRGKVELINDLKECCEIAETALLAAGFSLEN